VTFTRSEFTKLELWTQWNSKFFAWDCQCSLVHFACVWKSMERIVIINYEAIKNCVR